MDLNKTLAELHEERDRIDEAILMFSRLAAGAPKRGRPPKSTVASAVPQTEPRRQRKGMSKDARKAQSERMKEFWAAKRKAKA
jgi:hypothetical protein